VSGAAGADVLVAGVPSIERLVLPRLTGMVGVEHADRVVVQTLVGVLLLHTLVRVLLLHTLVRVLAATCDMLPFTQSALGGVFCCRSSSCWDCSTCPLFSVSQPRRPMVMVQPAQGWRVHDAFPTQCSYELPFCSYSHIQAGGTKRQRKLKMILPRR
jgi:hypothetical protein